MLLFRIFVVGCSLQPLGGLFRVRPVRGVSFRVLLFVIFQHRGHVRTHAKEACQSMIMRMSRCKQGKVDGGLYEISDDEMRLVTCGYEI